LTLDGILTLIGTVVTMCGMGITIWQASQARDYKNQIKFDIRKIILANVAERLRQAQEEIRWLPTSAGLVSRGVRLRELIHKILEQLDDALGTLNVVGPDADIRTLLAKGQETLNSYENSWNAGTPNVQDVHRLQAEMQDAVLILNTTIYRLGGKA